MPFNSLFFWACFIGIYGVFLFLRNHVALRNVWLLAVSYALYFAWDGRFVFLLFFLTLFGYVMGFALHRSPRKKILLYGSIVVHIAVLAIFKHFGFFTASLQEAAALIGWTIDLPTSRILLPLGISFYIFQLLGYHIDIYRGAQHPSGNFVDFALFVAFFPKIVSGPIERASHLLPQLQTPSHLTVVRIREGLFLTVWGLFLKFVIAENAAVVADFAFEHPSNLHFLGIVGALAFTLQIYADFAGYSAIAKGIAALFGIELSWNFLFPYAAGSPRVFWRRWHISLSEWFRDYVYFPLGGSRKGETRTIINLIVTMTLVGLWHGTQTMFILWGAYQGLLLAVYRLGAGATTRLPHLRKLLSSPWIAIPVFFPLTVIGWMLFRSKSPEDFWTLFSGIDLRLTDPITHWYIAALWMPVLAMDIYAARRGNPLALAHTRLPVQIFFSIIAFYALLLLPPVTSRDFIYVSF